MTTLVLLPGLDGTGRLFAPLLAELPHHWRTQVLSYPVDPQLGYDALTARVARALPADGSIVLLGESFSGPIAIALAAQLGERLQALILCCSFASNPRPALSPFAPLVACLPSPAQLPASLNARILLGTRPSSETRGLLMQALADLPATVVRARLRMVLKVDASAALARVRSPVLYLQAEQDWLVPQEAARVIVRNCPHAVVMRIAGPHGLLQTAPVPCAAAMTSFLMTRP